MNETLANLSNAIREIHNKNASNLSFEELYRNAYNMVLHRHGEKLYNGVKDVIKEYLENSAVERIVPAFPSGGAGGPSSDSRGVADREKEKAFLQVIKDVWDHHMTSLLMIRDILMYMDRVYSSQKHLPLTYELGILLFKDCIARSPLHPIRKHIQATLLSMIKRERTGEIVEKSLLKSVIDMLCFGVSSLPPGTVYDVDFEAKFLEASHEFYCIESQLLLGNGDVIGYLRKIESRLSEEEVRVAGYLYYPTLPKIIRIVEKELIQNHLKTMIEMEGSGVVNIIETRRIDDLRRMYNIFSRVPTGLEELRNAIANYIKSLGHQINSKLASPNSVTKSDSATISPSLQWVSDVLKLKEDFEELLNVAFNKNKDFQTCFDEAFKDFINENKRSPEFISLFVDDTLKKVGKVHTDAAADTILNSVISIFRLLTQQDTFERYYKQHLAKRLLLNKSASDDAERSMVSKLKVECGVQFTLKLEGMFKDMTVSKDLEGEWKGVVINSPLPFDISVTVLTATFWPLPALPQMCNLPVECRTSIEAFEKFYHGRYSGRKLTWQVQMGTADIKAQFNTKKHEINVSTYGMVALMMFNNHDTLTYEEIESETNIPSSDLKRTLQALSLAKYKILKKSDPKSKEIDPSTTFTFNSSFSNPAYRFKIQTISTKVETEAEKKETDKKIEEDRRYLVEACIVRIMKSRKRLEHNELITEVTQQLGTRFLPSPQMIKKRIEALIDREYLERQGDRLVSVPCFPCAINSIIISYLTHFSRL
ncbi:Cullin-3 [Paraphysoderma sedebokerense]|nr:Cullin-3 [Paraphysoderma sedebokerense]